MMDEYIEQPLAEMPESTLQARNILDEPIPEAAEGGLLKPLKPRKSDLPFHHAERRPPRDGPLLRNLTLFSAKRF